MNIQLHPEVEQFIKKLQPQTTAKVLRTIDLLARFGQSLSMPHSKPIGNGLHELRVRGQQEVRILYTFTHDGSVLLCACIKKQNRLPANILNTALKRKNELDNI